MTDTDHPLVVDAPPGLPTMTITRDFDAAPEAVFRAWTDPELIVRWLGPDGVTMTIEQWDARTGGSYRYVHSGGDGERFGFRGSFHTVRPAELLVQTFEYDGWPDHVSLDLLQFVDLGGRTRLITRSGYLDVSARDAMVEAGMERGLAEGYRKLDGLLTR